jgi:type IV pilus assembly protein PilW
MNHASASYGSFPMTAIDGGGRAASPRAAPRAAAVVHKLWRSQRGLTLVEAMIAMTLSLLVLGVAVTLFSGTSRGRYDLERSNRLAEATKFALEMLSEDVRHAGFYDGVTLSGAAWQTPDPCTTTRTALGVSVAPFQLPVAIRGYRPADATPDCVANRRANTAMVTLRRLAVETTPVASANNAPYVQVSKCNKDLALWRYADQPSQFTLRNIDCATLADIRRLVVRTYFVASCNVCGRDTIPTLKRVDLEGDRLVETALVEGVEDLQVEYGFDTNGDGNADVFRGWLSGDAAAADNFWQNVVAVRLHVIGRSTDTEGGHTEARRTYSFGEAGSRDGATDAFKRQMLAALVRLPNVAGPRERP